MKTLITALITILLTGCLSYKQNDKWVTEPLFWGTETQQSEPIKLVIQVMPQAEMDKACEQFGIVRACTVNSVIYLQGKRQSASIVLSPDYINTLPTDTGKAGDMLADKLGLELGFNYRESLGHEALLHIFSNTKHMGKGTPHI